jgi:hypothetical protein
MKQTPLSSPGLTGRPSIPETPAIVPRSRGVLDRPVKPGDDSLDVASGAMDCFAALAMTWIVLVSIHHLFKKFSARPGRAQSIAISSPLPDSVM